MLVLVLILALIALAGLGFLVAVWFISRYRRADAASSAESGAFAPTRFRIKYIAAPLVLVGVSIVITVISFSRLPAEVGYHFTGEGTPDRWLTRETAVALMVMPQILLTGLVASLISGVSKLGLMAGSGSPFGKRPQRLFLLMGNVGVLPQIVLGIAMLDIFLYNAYDVHVIPTSGFIILLGIVTALLAALLVFFIQKVRRKGI